LSRLTLSPAHYENVLSIYIWNIPSKAWHIYIYKIKKMNKKINKIKHTHTQKKTTNKKKKKILHIKETIIV
jgi:hypothetical protein